MANIDLFKKHLQIHADCHKGIEAARCRVFPGSVRCLDFAHLTGSNRLASQKNVSDPSDDRLRIWRKGIFASLTDLLLNKEHLPLLEFAVFTTRSLGLGLFSSLWQAMLRRLRAVQPPEEEAYASLCRYWLDELPDGEVCAAWRAAPGCSRGLGQGPSPRRAGTLEN